MEYVKGEPYFVQVAKKLKSYPYLNKNLDVDILIIGGGINGAIVNYYLSKKYNVALVDSSRIGYGCTSSATALLEYQLDDFASDLSKVLSDEEISDCYRLGLKSIDKLDKLIEEIGNKCHFRKCPTLIFSKSALDKNAIIKEIEFRKRFGFKVKLITKENSPFPFDFNYGIYAENGGAELNPYLFTKSLIEHSKNQDSIFENTKIIKIDKTDNHYEMETNFGEKIRAKRVIVCTGFNFEFVKNKKLCEIFISYTIVTNPLPNLKWYKNTLLQDNASPYHYIRFLPDNRIICGGEDTLLKGNIDEKKALKKYNNLLKFLKEMFPAVKDEIKIEYRFCGAFGGTENNMGLIGEDKDGIIDFISCGANGIINAMRGVELVENIIENKPDKFIGIFSPIRE